MTNPTRVISRDTPHESAIMFRNECRPTLIVFRSDALVYNGASYSMIENDTIESEIEHFLIGASVMHLIPILDKNGNDTGKFKKTFDPFNPKSRDVGELFAALSRQFHVGDGELSPPCWLDGGTGIYEGVDPRNIIACQNGLLDITTRTFYPPTPNFFTRTAVAIDYDPEAPEPSRWLQFIAEVLGEDDHALHELFQELFGYLVSTNTHRHKIAFFRGPPRSGKGTSMRVLDELVGPDNVANPSIDDLSERSGREDLIGKSIAKVTEMNCDDKSSLSKAVGHMLAISGCDRVSIFRKFKKAWNGFLASRFVLGGNQLPNFGDHATAFASRLIVIPFDVSFLGREDVMLTETLKLELPGILNWVLDGLDRLNANNGFTVSESSRNALDDVLNSGDPIRGFARERCEFDTEFQCSTDDIYNDYADYCHKINAHPFSKNIFVSKFKVAFPRIKPSRPREGAERERVFNGVRLRMGAAIPQYLVKRFRIDPDLAAFGFEGDDILARDGSGNPIEWDKGRLH